MRKEYKGKERESEERGRGVGGWLVTFGECEVELVECYPGLGITSALLRNRGERCTGGGGGWGVGFRKKFTNQCKYGKINSIYLSMRFYVSNQSNVSFAILIFPRKLIQEQIMLLFNLYCSHQRTLTVKVPVFLFCVQFHRYWKEFIPKSPIPN
jgi:hypothetical protein